LSLINVSLSLSFILYIVRDETCALWLYLVRLMYHDLYLVIHYILVACVLEKICNVCHMCDIHVVFTFIRTILFRVDLNDVMLYIPSLWDISYHMHHSFILSYTVAPHRCNDLGGVTYVF